MWNRISSNAFGSVGLLAVKSQLPEFFGSDVIVQLANAWLAAEHTMATAAQRISFLNDCMIETSGVGRIHIATRHGAPMDIHMCPNRRRPWRPSRKILPI